MRSLSDCGPFFSIDRPFHTTPPELHMRAANLSGFARLAVAKGGDPIAVLERHDINPIAATDPDHHMLCKSFVELLEYCSGYFDDPLFGLRLALTQRPEIYGAVAALCRSAPTIRDAVNSFLTYIPVMHSPESMMEFVEGTETSELRWHVRPEFGASDQISFQAVLLNLRLLQAIGGSDMQISYVNFTGTVRHRHIPTLENELGCRVHTNRPMHVIAFPTEALGERVASADDLLYRLIGSYLDRIRETGSVAFPDRVEQYVRSSLPSGMCSIENCARKLGVSVRFVQKQLSQVGVTFSEILERERMELAKSYLGKDGMTLGQIAVLLSYSDQTSFGRAFKRWTGCTPRRYWEVQNSQTH